MGLNNTFVLGRNTKTTLQNESVFGAGPPTNLNQRWLPGDSMQILGGYSVEPTQDRKVRKDARQTRSAFELIQGQRSNSMTVRSYVLPPTTPGSPSLPTTTGLPDIAPLLRATFGVETVGATSVTYSLSNGQTVPPSVTALFETNGVRSDLVLGMVVEEFRLTVPNGDEPSMEFTGPFREHVTAGNATATAAAVGGALTETLTFANTDESRMFDAGAYINWGTSTNLRIVSVNHTTNTAVVQSGADPGVTNVAAGTGTAVTPFSAYAEGSGSAGLEPATLIASINGQLDLGPDTDVVVQSCELQIKNTWSEVRPAFTDLLVDQNPGWREVTGTITFWLRDVDIIRAIARPRVLNTPGVNPVALTITLGGMASGDGQVVINIPAAHLNYAAAEIPEAEAGSVQVPFTALASTLTAENEINMVFSTTP